MLFHLYSIALELNPGYERDWSYPVTRLVHILVEPFGAAFALVQMARNGAFTPKEREFLIPTTAQAETVLLREKALAKASEASQVTWRTHFVFPERLWSYGAIGMVIGYFASGSLLIAVTKPNVMRDPIYNVRDTKLEPQTIAEAPDRSSTHTRTCEFGLCLGHRCTRRTTRACSLTTCRVPSRRTSSSDGLYFVSKHVRFPRSCERRSPAQRCSRLRRLRAQCSFTLSVPPSRSCSSYHPA